MSRYWLVQRLRLSPASEWREKFPQAKVASNPFGYGRLGDYELDYMGAAEFEFGAIPEANNRLAKGKLQLVEFDYGGHKFDFLYRDEDGEPFEEWVAWAEGRPESGDRPDYKCPPFDGKEPPYELRRRLDGQGPFGDEWRTAIWWALNENVQWSFHEDGHLHRMLESMQTTPAEFLR